jgi:hypothetical protein
VIEELEPPIPTAEELEASVKRARESVALWLWGDVYFENELMWREIIAQAKEEVMTREPWMRQFFS